MRTFAIVLALGLTGCRGNFAEHTVQLQFVDDDATTFGQGSYSGTLGWHTDKVTLNGPPFDATASVFFTSRLLDSGDDTATWTTLAWLPAGPHGRPLPDGGARETAYQAENIDMAANTLLLHLDASAIADGTTVSDTSGRQHDGTMKFTGQGASPISGLFGGAFDIARDAYVSVPGTFFDFGLGDETFAIWVKMFDCSQSNDNRVAMGGEGPNGIPHIWIGASCPETCPANDSASWIVSAQRGSGNESYVSGCSGISLIDGAWHLLAGTKVGQSPATLHLYVDGRELGTSTHDYGTASFDYAGGEIRLGSFNLGDPQYNTRITVDEAAIWKRALAAGEIQDLYLRGALHLELQVRVCADHVCDTEPFIGPDGTETSFFSEADLVGAPGSEQDNLRALGLVGAVAQYRVRFGTATQMASPGLLRVEIDAATMR